MGEKDLELPGKDFEPFKGDPGKEDGDVEQDRCCDCKWPVTCATFKRCFYEVAS